MADTLSTSTNSAALSNVSTTASSRGFEFVEPEASKVLRIVIWSLASVASLVGNAIVLKATRELPGRIPLSYHLVSNLAAAEIINIICMQFPFVSSEIWRWPFGESACKVIMTLEALSLFVVTNTLAAIAVYRFALIAFQCRITTSNRKVVLLLSLMWFYALLIVLPLFIYHESLSTKFGPWCTTYHTDNMTYQMIRFVLNYGLPYLVMVLCYAAVAFELKRHIKRSAREAGVRMSVLGESSARQTAETGVGEDQQEHEHEQEQGNDHPQTQRENCRGERPPQSIVRLENDLLKMVYIIIVVFAVCYLPYQLDFLLFKFNEHYVELFRPHRDIMIDYVTLLTIFPGALHPVCYGTMSKFYARAFSRLVLCRRIYD